MTSALANVPLFAALSDADLALLESNTTVKWLSDGEMLFGEGDPGDTAYVITEGSIEITKRTGGKDVLLALRKPGEVIGEMALLQEAPRMASGVAKGATAVIVVPRSNLEELMAQSADAVRVLFDALVDRLQATQALMAQNERMIQLGTLTAGLAHEMNNPAAAAQRAAGQLREAIGRLRTAERALGAVTPPTGITDLLDEAAARRPAIPLSAIELSDLEAELEDRLDDAGVADAWRLGPALAEAGLADLVEPVLDIAGDDAGAVFGSLAAAQAVLGLAHEVEEGSKRLSTLVNALKSYSYLDQGPVQAVNIVASLEDTLLILKNKLEGIDVRREYDPDLGEIEAHGAELNQVWTNLIDNAAYAIGEGGGTIVVRARPERDGVVVEVADDGDPIPDNVLSRVFDAFFTTKPPGHGTGQGLTISHGIVVDRHRGEITVDQSDGWKTFRVWIPSIAPD